MNAVRFNPGIPASEEITRTPDFSRSGSDTSPASTDPYNRPFSMDAIQWLRVEFERRMRILGPVAPIVDRLLFPSMEKRYRQFLQSEGPIFPAALRTLRLDYECSAEDLLRIPRAGPVIVVANHPYREWEGPLLGAILSSIREDFRFLAASDAIFGPPFRDFLIPIVRRRDLRPFDSNCGSLRAAVRWLRSGGLVVVFPAGRMAIRSAPTFKLTEQPWSDMAAVLARWSGAAVVPVFFHGSNHWLVYAAGLLHRDLRYFVWISQEIWRKPSVIRVSIGKPIRVQPIIEQSGLQHTTAYLRSQTLNLNDR